MNKFVLLIHGGAGTISEQSITPEKASDYKKALHKALKAGEKILSAGGKSLDAVESAVGSMEDCPLFNAGKGSVFNAQGTHEMESSIMCGKTLQAGAASALSRIKNPVTLARKILEDAYYVYLNGEGAAEFAQKHQLSMADDAYFYTQERYEQWQKARATGETILDHSGAHKFGTVGAVALDLEGNLAAATSTGGLTNKSYGRIGDSPIIGTGTYANNSTCAVSCTGYGEYFIRNVVAYDISCLMEYKKLPLKEACELVVMKKLKNIGGEGGLIALDAKGNFDLPFNSEGMYRGWIDSEEQIFHTRIFRQ
ncbi:MAG: isoaspartyl peptidase/L-asparaginase family protein [Candidatus Cyclobacteriaceae bacterium M3_2C_046]